MKLTSTLIAVFVLTAGNLAAGPEREGTLVDIADLGGGEISSDNSKSQTRIEREGTLVDIADLGGGAAKVNMVKDEE